MLSQAMIGRGLLLAVFLAGGAGLAHADSEETLIDGMAVPSRQAPLKPFAKRAPEMRTTPAAKPKAAAKAAPAAKKAKKPAKKPAGKKAGSR